MTDRRREEMGPRSSISREDSADGPGEMRMVSDLDRAQDDAMLSGDAARVPDDMVAVVRIVAALRARAAAEPVPPMSPALRAQLEAPNVVALRAARSVRRAVVFAAAVLAVVALVGVGAARNQLPGGLQDVVASTAEKLGIDVPRSSERGDVRSDEGFEHGRDDTAPDAPGLVGALGHDGTPPGGATPAIPGGPDGPATPATPPDHAAPREKEAPQTPAPATPETPESPPGQGGSTPPSNPRGSSGSDGESSPPPSHPNGGSSNAGGSSGATPAADAPGQRK